MGDVDLSGTNVGISLNRAQHLLVVALSLDVIAIMEANHNINN